LDLEKFSPRVRRLIYRTATLLGVVLLAGAGLEAGASLRLVRSGQHLTGKVVDMGARTTATFVAFSRPDGDIVSFRAKGLMWPHVGQTVPVILDPTRPGDPPVAATPVALWLVPGLMAVFGGVLFIFGFGRREPLRRG
jgi:hypothetical protein